MISDDGCVIHDVRFPHPVERVWNAIVDRAALEQWLMASDFEPRVGHRFRFDAGPPRGFFDAEVLALDPPHRIEWRWIIDGAPTTVTITLTPDHDDGTLLHLEHKDLPPDPRLRFDSGWGDKCLALATLLEETK